MKKPDFPVIHIIGLPGAGKTTLTEKLNKKFKLPIYRIGTYRARFPMTAMGEVDAWLALRNALSRRRWGNCILETTGLNKRESFLTTALPLGRKITIKLEASRETPYQRIRQKKKREQGGEWLYSMAYPDKYTFVRKFFKKFRQISADYCIDTNRRTKSEVSQLVLKEINNYRGWK